MNESKNKNKQTKNEKSKRRRDDHINYECVLFLLLFLELTICKSTKIYYN